MNITKLTVQKNKLLPSEKQIERLMKPKMTTFELKSLLWKHKGGKIMSTNNLKASMNILNVTGQPNK